MTRSSDPPDKLSIVVFSGDFARVHYALLLASGAAAIGRAATLFFTMEAVHALEVPDAAGTPGWARLSVAGPETALECERRYRTAGVAGIEDLIEACRELRVRFLVCEAGLKATGIEEKDLRADLPIEVAGAVTFLNDASAHGAAMFI